MNGSSSKPAYLLGGSHHDPIADLQAQLPARPYAAHYLACSCCANVAVNR
jgi:hypothetical protein